MTWGLMCSGRHCEPEAWQSSIPDGGQSACSTLFSSAVSENNCLRISFEGTSLVRRIEGLASAVRCQNQLKNFPHAGGGSGSEGTERGINYLA